MESQNPKEETITHIFGLLLPPNTYKFVFHQNDKVFLSDFYRKTLSEEEGEVNYVEIKTEKKEQLVKFYVCHPFFSNDVYISGTWDSDFPQKKHKMLVYEQGLLRFRKKENEFIGLEELKQKNFRTS